LTQVDKLSGLLYLLGYGLGLDSPKTFLIVGQKETELRSTGGFIGLVWEVDMERGELKGWQFMNSYDVDTSEGRPFTLKVPMRKMMPGPFAKYLFGYSPHPWLFRDSNWWADFPSSAIEIVQSYRYATGREVDGVIAATEPFACNIVDALAGIYLPAIQRKISSKETEEFITGNEVYPVHPGHLSRDPKRAFAEDLSKALLKKFKQGLSREERIPVAKVLLQALEGRSVFTLLLRFAVHSPPPATELGWTYTP